MGGWVGGGSKYLKNVRNVFVMFEGLRDRILIKRYRGNHDFFFIIKLFILN